MHLRRIKVIGLGIESNKQITGRPPVRAIQWLYIPKTGNELTRDFGGPSKDKVYKRHPDQHEH